jgi:hypothetical protein
MAAEIATKNDFFGETSEQPALAVQESLLNLTLGVGGVGTTWHLRKLPQILINCVSAFPAYTVIFK